MWLSFGLTWKGFAGEAEGFGGVVSDTAPAGVRAIVDFVAVRLDLSRLGSIGLIGPLPPPAGGMANQTRQLAELLLSAKADVLLVQTNAPYRPLWVRRLPVVRAACRLLPYMWALWCATGRCKVVHLMANSGWAWHLFAAPAIWVAHWRGVPVVVNYRGGEAGQFLKRSHALVRWTMCRATCLVVPSPFLKEVFADFGMAATIVPNIVDLNRFRSGERRRNDAVHLVVARNLEPLYDNANALRAFKIVREHWPSARLTIAGTGPEAAHLRQLATDLELESAVRFAGRLDRDDMAALYRTADIMLNPSLADNMPNSILESLASGVPVVSTNVGGVPHMVRDRNTALLVPPADPAAMAAACLELIANDALWQQLSLAGLAEVQQYTWEHVAPLLVDSYYQAMSKVRE